MNKNPWNDVLSKLNIDNPLDILRIFPSRYESLNPTDLSFPLEDQSKVVCFGKLISIKGAQHGRILFVEAECPSSKGKLKAMIFNQSFYQKSLFKGKEYAYFGFYSKKRNQIYLSSVLALNNLLLQNKYKPVYALPAAVSQSSFYKVVLEVLELYKDYLSLEIPSFYIHKYRLENAYQAFKDVHVPVDYETVKRGLRVFKYEEALKYSTYVGLVNLEKEKLKKREIKKIDKIKINALVKSLPYTLTASQLDAIRDIVLDMDSSKPMNRLLEGDVGTGKTIVSLIACYANCLRGGQGVILAPTQTLVIQHYENAIKTFKNLNIDVELVLSSLTAKRKAEIQAKAKDGSCQVFIGTHALISSSLQFKTLSLVIIDEQHKFGVEQRESLEEKGESVDCLMMSATPIPQTLTKAINFELKVSLLKEFPNSVREVETKIVTSKDPLILSSISKALKEKRQVYIVAPKIEANDKSARVSSKEIYEEIVSRFGEDNVIYLNGRMKSESKEEAYRLFALNKKPILVSTSLIEVGMDVPNAGLLIVYEANYFGLASLHQLRGRIGRDGKKAMAIFVYDGDDQKALEKLDFISKTNDGEKIAVYDLENRGGGDIFSSRQSGHSILRVCNFVKDLNIFSYAQKDAKEILKNLQIKENLTFVLNIKNTYMKEQD